MSLTGHRSFFFLIISLFFVFFLCVLFYVILLLLIFTKTMLLLSFYLINFFFHENYFYFFMFRDVPACSGMFRYVPVCSGMFHVPCSMFHVPGFIDALKIGTIGTITKIANPVPVIEEYKYYFESERILLYNVQVIPLLVHIEMNH